MDIFDKLRSEVMQLDAKDETRAAKRGERYNIYALSKNTKERSNFG